MEHDPRVLHVTGARARQFSREHQKSFVDTRSDRECILLAQSAATDVAEDVVLSTAIISNVVEVYLREAQDRGLLTINDRMLAMIVAGED